MKRTLSAFEIVIGIATIVACVAAVSVVPEIRRFLGLDPKPIQSYGSRAQPGSSANDISSTYQIEVFANKSWQDTAINIRRGDLVTIEYVSGTWGKYRQDANGDPAGYTCAGAMPASQCTELVPEAVQGSLVGKIDKQILKISNYIEFTSEQDGSLLLSQNYDSFGFPNTGDTGQIIVQVTVKRGR